MPVAPIASSTQTLTPAAYNLPSLEDVLRSDVLSTSFILTPG